MRKLQVTSYKLEVSKQQTEEELLFAKRGGVVHRLDKESSGVMVLARTPAALVELMRQFRERETKKEYVALVHGKLSPKAGFVSVPMRRTTRDRTKFGVGLGGRMTRTDYQVVGEYTSTNSKYSDGFCLVELMPKTGRTHQLRVLLKHLQHPIVADDKYLGGKRLREDNKWCRRLFLHARKLGFIHPKDGKWVEYEVGLPEELEEAWGRIR